MIGMEAAVFCVFLLPLPVDTKSVTGVKILTVPAGSLNQVRPFPCRTEQDKSWVCAQSIYCLHSLKIIDQGISVIMMKIHHIHDMMAQTSYLSTSLFSLLNFTITRVITYFSYCRRLERERERERETERYINYMI